MVKTSQSYNSGCLLWAIAGFGYLTLALILSGVIIAILIPRFRDNTIKDKQEKVKNVQEIEAKNIVIKITQAQKKYRLKQPSFANTIKDLDLEVPSHNKQYNFSFIPQSNKAKVLVIEGRAKYSSRLKSYLGVVFAFESDGKIKTFTGICESKDSKLSTSNLITIKDEIVSCPEDYNLIDMSPSKLYDSLRAWEDKQKL